MSLTKHFRFVVPRIQQCLYTTGTSGSDKADKTTSQTKTPAQTPKPSPTPQTNKTVTDGSTYNCNTYYEHREWSFYDIENQMSVKRVGQPSKFDKLQ